MGRILRLSALALIALWAVACADHAPPPIATARMPQLVDCNVIIFFQIGSHALDATARRVLDEVVAVARTGWRPRTPGCGPERHR